MRNVSAHALVSMALLTSFIAPAGRNSAMAQLAQRTDSQKQFDEALAAFNRGDNATALRLLTPLAKQGLAKAQEKLGVIYYEGRGVARDYAQALAWFRKAADQGDANAPFYLGVMYHDGLGVAKDNVAAVGWYRKAAEQGTAAAQLNLGAAYADGEGVARDDAAAVGWYRKAADQGHALAQNNLAFMYENGRGVAQDRGQALMWYRKAAEQGNTLARNNLSRLGAEPRATASVANWVTIVSDDSSTLYYDASSVERSGQYTGAAIVQTSRKPITYHYGTPQFSYQSYTLFVWIDCVQQGRPYRIDYIVYYSGPDLTGTVLRQVSTHIFESEATPRDEGYPILLLGSIFLRDRIC